MGKICALDHDLVFWVGDLNYRMDVEVKDEKVFELLRVVADDRGKFEKGNVEEAGEMLLGYDQLNTERRNNRVFQGEDGRGEKRRGIIRSIGNEDIPRMCLRPRRTIYQITTLFLVLQPNPFRNLLRSWQVSTRVGQISSPPTSIYLVTR